MIIQCRQQDTIFRRNLSDNVIMVLCRLNKAGYEAYLVGGCVRDLLLGKQPKDFDVTTNATPEQIRRLFYNCRVVGRRFRLAHIIFRKEVIEVSTFRGNSNSVLANSTISKCGRNRMLLHNNIFGSIEEDACRRDFTINSLYYNVADITIRDYVGGIQDLKNGFIRLIGNPEVRYREDPVRMLRAVRFAAKLNMRISPETSAPISQLSILINNVSPARLFEEALKLLQDGYGFTTYQLLREYNLFQSLFPSIARYFTKNQDTLIECIIKRVLKNTDTRIRSKMRTNPAFLFAVIFWYPLVEAAKYITQRKKLVLFDAFTTAINHILNEARNTLAFPKSITSLMRDIWKLQLYMSYYRDKYAWKLIIHPRFRIAYNLLILRAEVGKNNELKHLVKKLEKIQTSMFLSQKEILHTFNNN